MNGTRSGDLWVGGDSTGALHFDGQHWSRVETTLSATEAFWAASPRDVWAVGTAVPGQGGIAHFDGTAFTLVFQGGGEIDDVWGTAPDNVYAAGLSGVFHWDGAAWTPVAANVIGSSIDGGGPADIWVGTFDGLWHFDGSSWQRVPELQQHFVQDVAVTGPRDVWVLSAISGTTQVNHFDGTTWTVSDSQPTTGASTWALGAGGPNDVWVVGTSYGPPPLVKQSGLLRHFDGRAWTTLANAPTPLWEMHRVGGADYAVGVGGRILRLQAGATPPFTDLTQGPPVSLMGVWGTSPSNMWAVGESGTALHYYGHAVTTVATGTSAALNDVWGTAAGDVWAVGQAGTLLHWTGGAWAPVLSATTADLFAVFSAAPGDVWIGGDAATLLHVVGGVVTPVALAGLSAPAQILDLHGTSAGDIWLSGGNGPGGGFVAHYDGTAWAAVDFLTANSGSFPETRIWAVASNDVWALTPSGFRGSIGFWHFDGTAWTERFMPPSPETWMFNGTELDGFAFGPDDVWSVGPFGAWRRHVP